jgi:hypothetical protein
MIELILIVLFVCLIALLWYFKPDIDVQNYQQGTIYILWYNYKGERLYKYLHIGRE